MTAPSSVLVMTPNERLFISYPICAPGKYTLSGKRARKIWGEVERGPIGRGKGWYGKAGRG
jgi:hypothetical protein